MNVLALNAGSATLKYKLFGADDSLLAAGSVDHPGGDGIVSAAREAIEKCRPLGIHAVGHRLVHGGTTFTEPTRVTPDVLYVLRGLRDLDPLHNPTETAMIAAGLSLLHNIPAVVVFDTAFHRTIPETAWRYALPRGLCDHLHLRRYGFHGLSYQYVSSRLAELMLEKPRPPLSPPASGEVPRDEAGWGPRLIICHLGSGASVCAIRDGASVDTSMGMTPVEGLVMSTRSGDVDAGLLLYLRRTGMSTETLDDLLNHRSGLLGLSGLSGDVRVLEMEAKGGDANAELALSIFAYRVRKYIGAYAAVLDGVDAVAFTGGIGEHSADMRRRICRSLGYLGLQLDDDRNHSVDATATRISSDASTVQAWVVPTDEERQIARETRRVLQP